MQEEIRLVSTRREPNLNVNINHEKFHSGVVEAINQLVEQLAKPKKDPRSLNHA